MEEEGHTCEFCGSSTHEATVRMCLWEGERLVVVEGVPARVCDKCLEQFYDELTMFKIDRLRGSGFPAAEAGRTLAVPVFAFPQEEVAAKPQEGTTQPDRYGQVYDWWARV